MIAKAWLLLDCYGATYGRSYRSVGHHHWQITWMKDYITLCVQRTDANIGKRPWLNYAGSPCRSRYWSCSLLRLFRRLPLYFFFLPICQLRNTFVKAVIIPWQDRRKEASRRSSYHNHSMHEWTQFLNQLRRQRTFKIFSSSMTLLSQQYCLFSNKWIKYNNNKRPTDFLATN